jgi:anti-sigma regulatory factor (Ser/Thr protein kinase)
MHELRKVMTRRFRPCPASIGAARDAMREALAGAPAEIVEDAALIVSELASNCVQHARSDFELLIETDGDVRVELQDQSTAEPKIHRSDSCLGGAKRQLSGRGLRIVDALSDHWGVIEKRGGKAVWFTLRVT